MKYVTTVNNQQYTIDIDHAGEIIVNGQVINVDMLQMQDTTTYSMIINGESFDIRLNEGEDSFLVQLSGELFEVVVEDERTRRLAGLKSSAAAMAGEIVIKAPMPGVVIDVLVQPGQTVEAGDIVVILESMKMQNEFKAPRAGTVHNVRVTPGDKVEQNSAMITLT